MSNFIGKDNMGNLLSIRKMMMKKMMMKKMVMTKTKTKKIQTKFKEDETKNLVKKTMVTTHHQAIKNIIYNNEDEEENYNDFDTV